MTKNEFEAGCQNGDYAALAPYKAENAVIMAAGISSRFSPLSQTTPKPLLKVKGEIMIERQIRQLIEAGISQIYVVVGYKKELFYYLEEKYGVHIVENTEYETRNNHSSIYAVREFLGNTYICSSDNYFMENVFEPYVFESYYSLVYSNGRTDKYCPSSTFNGKINHVRQGGCNTWCMTGHAYWNRRFSREYIDILEAEYDFPATRKMCWEDLYIHHLDKLALYVRRYPDGVIREFNNLEELCLFDTSYMPYRDSLINGQPD